MSQDPEDWIDPDFKRGYEAARRSGGNLEPQEWMSEQFLRGMRAATLPVRRQAAGLARPRSTQRRTGTA